ncbi:O-acetylhomoserine aminocarboxypropyltransferase/cysteine synthase family protein [Eubacterium coprostanoligenes]|uniref:O-acetylhomoserine aminocarboxypropyltransferase/cysteine synthase family protein n=1 Tax=Eubacterium coprostanoligenes TaxID=290054 RepID=UPI002354E98C|nr:O-acetylhomoserine aminocarboxypropyltransferase/cysteine synthase family protein [Eubacterium coprostanoligenes]MCI6254256.1 O-acetylhomoserine aminocarboxypropyltransferase/cysteine synthase [Eubacterium coprostanoligenes]MDY5376785.1 O-acetylhomoserine aminocarboxypropyltransferase/cysteine synthase family protein [Eubacterium coprostanoligenes]MDY5399258.1 O-acetylhomoserine aminocarboxypropyltransferase/cysteine synthase family protein [Eubacterium coprostanoligenes]
MKLDTICVQGTYKPKNGEPRVIPIVQSTTFKYDSSAEMGDLFDLKKSGYFYSRLQNPTCDNVASKIAALEGGVAGMLTSSGQAANFYAVFNIAQAGDHIVSSSAIYGGTFNLFNVTMRKLGIDFTFVSPTATEEEIQAAIKPNTKAIFGETISNPSLDILDIETFAKVAHKNGIPLIVDNTFATPINCRVFDFGVDIVTHSTTKYMEGHASTIGGAIVDSGNFDWTQNDKYPGLTTPDDSYHGIVYTDTFGKGAYITKATVQLMRDLGSVQSPNEAFLLNVGLESLHLRVQRHCENAKKVAEYLENHPKIEWVKCSMLPSDSQYALAQKYMPNGTCGVVSFGVKGGRDAATTFMDSLELAAVVTHVADARTCCLHPASTTHRQLTDEQLAECGVTPDLVRFSCGIEAAEDIIADIEQALNKI